MNYLVIDLTIITQKTTKIEYQHIYYIKCYNQFCSSVMLQNLIVMLFGIPLSGSI